MLTAEGSAAGRAYVEEAGERFEGEHSDAAIEFIASDTDAAFARLCAGEIEVAIAARPIQPGEAEACARRGIDAEALEIASDAVAVVANSDLEISCLRTDQLKELWMRGSRIAALAELGPDQDTGEPLPAGTLNLHGPPTESDTIELFGERVVGREDRVRRDYVAAPGDEGAAQELAEDENGFGLVDFADYQRNSGGTTLVAIDAGDGCTVPSVETLQDGSYRPLSRPLYAYFSSVALREPEVREFERQLVDDGEEIAEAASTVPPPARSQPVHGNFTRP